MSSPIKPHLGAIVSIVAAGDIQGLIVEHTRFLDGSERFAVQYWDSAKRETVNCMAQELIVVKAEIMHPSNFRESLQSGPTQPPPGAQKRHSKIQVDNS